MRRNLTWFWILIGLVLLDGLILHWWFQKRTERYYDQVIRYSASRYGLDPALVKAVIWRESAFQAEARGKAGEIGLMQLRSAAAEEWARAEKVHPFAHEHVLDPRTNTLAGAWYLSKLLKRYRDTDLPLAYALADYNAGRRNVLRWMDGEAQTNSHRFLGQIDFPTTRQYVDAVLRQYHRYGIAR